MEFGVAILAKRISNITHVNWMCTYRRFLQFGVVGFTEDCVVKVIKGRFTLKGKFVEGVEDVEGEGCLWSIDRGRKPTGTQDLGSFMDKTVGTAVAKINRHMVDAGRINNEEIWWTSLGQRARCATMTKLNPKAQFLKIGLVEK